VDILIDSTLSFQETGNMSRSQQTPLEQQITRAHRRLTGQSIVDSLIACWALGFLGAALWLLAQPFFWTQSPLWTRWMVSGEVFAVSTIAGVAIGRLRAPTRLMAALTLDSTFGLKERATTSLTLTPTQQASPAGLALLADATECVKDLDVGSRFPIRLS